MKYIWITQKGDYLNVDEIDNVYHLRNIIKMLMRNSATSKDNKVNKDFVLHGDMAQHFNDQQDEGDERSERFMGHPEDECYPSERFVDKHEFIPESDNYDLKDQGDR